MVNNPQRGRARRLGTGTRARSESRSEAARPELDMPLTLLFCIKPLARSRISGRRGGVNRFPAAHNGELQRGFPAKLLRLRKNLVERMPIA